MTKTDAPRAEIQEFLKQHPNRWISMVALSEVFDIDWGFIDRGMTDQEHFHRREFRVGINHGNPDRHDPQLRTFMCYTEGDEESVPPPRGIAASGSEVPGTTIS